MSKPRLMIIGFGRMGRRFAEVFSEGLDVAVSSTREVSDKVRRIGAVYVDDFDRSVSAADYIFIAVPLRALDSVIERVNCHVRPDTWAFDMCSARVAAAGKMSALKFRWFGLHGGGVFGDAPTEILDYLAERGYQFRPMTPEEHDARNGLIAMVHFIGMAMDSILSEDERRTLATSPAAMNLLKLIDHLKQALWSDSDRSGDSTCCK